MGKYLSGVSSSMPTQTQSTEISFDWTTGRGDELI